MRPVERVDLTVIGGGPVGLFAAFYAGLRGMSARIVDSLPELGGQLTALYPEKYVYDMPGFPEVLAKDLASHMAVQGLQFGAETVLGETARHLRAEGEEGYTIVTDSGLRLPTRTIIVAAGAGAFTPTRLGVEREEEFEGSGLYYGVREKAMFTGKDITIVGGGDSAFDWALNLEPIAARIRLIHRRDQFRAHEDSVRKVKDSRVEMHLFQVVKQLHGTSRLSGVTLEHTQTKETTTIETDAVIVNVGFKSSLGPLKEWGFEIDKNQIVVDRLGRTSLPGIYAVGDVCSYEGKLKLIATGVGEAATAVCLAKTHIDPEAKLFPGHSSDMDLGAKRES
jgi:thioredoxin reductase (NADPH)